MNYLIFGGAFDPPHMAHINVAKMALQKTHNDRVLFMPAYHSPFGKKMSSFEDRESMIRLALDNYEDEKLCCFDYETHLPTLRGTYHIVKAIKSIFHRKDHFEYLIGGDQAKSITHWIKWRELLQLVPFVVVTRDGEEGIPSIFYTGHHKVIVSPNWNVSSTQIREQIKSGKKPKELHDNVFRYIKQHNLYRGQK